MRTNRKKTLRMCLLMLILLLGIGFAALTANLKINGTVDVTSASWDVHFENVQVTTGSVTANPVPTSDDTTTTELTYGINFTNPGDFYEFTVDIVNDGTIDAMIEDVSNKVYASDGTTEITLPSYLRSTVKYSDGIGIAQNHQLLHGTSEKIKVRVEFRTDINPGDLPSTAGETIKFKFVGKFKQKDDNAIPKPTFGGELILEPENSTNTYKGIVYLDPENLKNSCSSSTSVSATGTKTGCMKFYIYDDSGSNYKMILDHNTTPYVSRFNAQQQLELDTAGWKNNPSFISAFDVANIVSNEEFDGTYNAWFYLDGTGSRKQSPITHTQGSNIYHWLFDNTYGCVSGGCSIEDNVMYVFDEQNSYGIDGYWTSTEYQGDTFYVDNYAMVDWYGVTEGKSYGIRPVITISKSDLQ